MESRIKVLNNVRKKVVNLKNAKYKVKSKLSTLYGFQQKNAENTTIYSKKSQTKK